MVGEKKILMISSSDYASSTRFYQIAKTLATNGNEVSLYCVDRKYEFPKKQKLENINVIFFRSFLTKLNMNFIIMPFILLHIYLKIFIKTLRSPKFDIIFSYDFDMLILSIILKKVYKSKLMYDSAEYYPGMIITSVPIIIYYGVRALYYKLARKADYVLTTNTWTKYQFKLAKVKKVQVISNVPDLTIFHFDLNQRVKIRNELNIKENVIVFSFLGFLSRYRGLEQLINACKILKNSSENFKILIIGKGPILNELIQKVNESSLKSYFIFKNFIPLKEVPKYLNASDITFILYNPDELNNWYAVPNKLFEAAACRRAVIGSDFGHLKKLILEMDCGILVDPKNEKEISDKMKYLIKNPNLIERLGNNGYKKIIEKYNLEYYSNFLYDVIKDLDG